MFKFLFTVLIGLVITKTTMAASTTINFDNLADGTVLSNQYQSLGVLASGATVLNANAVALPAHSGTNVAYAASGLMTFDFNPLMTGNIKTVSVYVSGDPNTGIFAYDSANNLVGQAILPTNSPANTLLSVTSSGNPIVQVDIHDGGTNFIIDDLTFVSGSVCSDGAQEIYNSIAALPLSAFRSSSLAASQLNSLKQSVLTLQQLIAANPITNKKQILLKLVEIGAKVELQLKVSAVQKNLLNMTYQLGLKVYNNQCI
jgi:hypothetical protein